MYFAGDIEFGSYELRDANISNTSASFFWLLKKPLPNMLEWGFIKGSQYNLTLFDGALIKNNTINDVSFTLNDLSPGQKYLICVTLITTDTDSWPPWPSCKNFMTKEGMYMFVCSIVIYKNQIDFLPSKSLVLHILFLVHCYCYYT